MQVSSQLHAPADLPPRKSHCRSILQELWPCNEQLKLVYRELTTVTTSFLPDGESGKQLSERQQISNDANFETQGERRATEWLRTCGDKYQRAALA
jgi:hypothetical protein